MNIPTEMTADMEMEKDIEAMLNAMLQPRDRVEDPGETQEEIVENTALDLTASTIDSLHAIHSQLVAAKRQALMARNIIKSSTERGEAKAAMSEAVAKGIGKMADAVVTLTDEIMEEVSKIRGD